MPPGIIRNPTSPRRNQPPTRAIPRSVCTLSPTWTRISAPSSMRSTAPWRSPAFSFSKKSSIVSTAPMAGVYRRPPMDADRGLRARLTEAWPLFGLELRSDLLSLRLPTDPELLDVMALARAGIHPPDEMPFASAWSTQESPAFERGYLAYHWLNRGGWSADSWELGFVVATHDGEVIGMQGVDARGFAVNRSIATGSWLGRPFQGRGYGREMRAAVLGFGFDGLGAGVATTEAFVDNPASNAVSRSLGYEENGFGQLAPNGHRRETRRFRMTEARWRSQPRPALEIIGLDACRSMFGA